MMHEEVKETGKVKRSEAYKTDLLAVSSFFRLVDLRDDDGTFSRLDGFVKQYLFPGDELHQFGESDERQNEYRVLDLAAADLGAYSIPFICSLLRSRAKRITWLRYHKDSVEAVRFLKLLDVAVKASDLGASAGGAWWNDVVQDGLELAFGPEQDQAGSNSRTLTEGIYEATNGRLCFQSEVVDPADLAFSPHIDEEEKKFDLVFAPVVLHRFRNWRDLLLRSWTSIRKGGALLSGWTSGDWRWLKGHMDYTSHPFDDSGPRAKLWRICRDFWETAHKRGTYYWREMRSYDITPAVTFLNEIQKGTCQCPQDTRSSDGETFVRKSEMYSQELTSWTRSETFTPLSDVRESLSESPSLLRQLARALAEIQKEPTYEFCSELLFKTWHRKTDVTLDSVTVCNAYRQSLETSMLDFDPKIAEEGGCVRLAREIGLMIGSSSRMHPAFERFAFGVVAFYQRRRELTGTNPNELEKIGGWDEDTFHYFFNPRLLFDDDGARERVLRDALATDRLIRRYSQLPSTTLRMLVEDYPKALNEQFFLKFVACEGDVDEPSYKLQCCEVPGERRRALLMLETILSGKTKDRGYTKVLNKERDGLVEHIRKSLQSGSYCCFSQKELRDEWSERLSPEAWRRELDAPDGEDAWREFPVAREMETVGFLEGPYDSLPPALKNQLDRDDEFKKKLAPACEEQLALVRSFQTESGMPATFYGIPAQYYGLEGQREAYGVLWIFFSNGLTPYDTGDDAREDNAETFEKFIADWLAPAFRQLCTPAAHFDSLEREKQRAQEKEKAKEANQRLDVVAGFSHQVGHVFGAKSGLPLAAFDLRESVHGRSRLSDDEIAARQAQISYAALLPQAFAQAFGNQESVMLRWSQLASIEKRVSLYHLLNQLMFRELIQPLVRVVSGEMNTHGAKGRKICLDIDLPRKKYVPKLAIIEAVLFELLWNAYEYGDYGNSDEARVKVSEQVSPGIPGITLLIENPWKPSSYEVRRDRGKGISHLKGMLAGLQTLAASSGPKCLRKYHFELMDVQSEPDKERRLWIARVTLPLVGMER